MSCSGRFDCLRHPPNSALVREALVNLVCRTLASTEHGFDLPPQVKISNLMRVLGEEATMDPTAIEQQVRQQMEERSQVRRL